MHLNSLHCTKLSASIFPLVLARISIARPFSPPPLFFNPLLLFSNFPTIVLTRAIRGRPLSPDRALAFLMALHGRLGRASPASLLNPAIAKCIAADSSAHPPRSVWL